MSYLAMSNQHATERSKMGGARTNLRRCSHARAMCVSRGRGVLPPRAPPVLLVLLLAHATDGDAVAHEFLVPSFREVTRKSSR